MLNLVKPISKKCLPMLALESHNCFCLLTYRDKSKNTLTVAGNTSGRRRKIFGEEKYLEKKNIWSAEKEKEENIWRKII